MALHDLEINFFFIHQNLNLLIRGLYFSIQFYFKILFKIKHCFEQLGGNDIIWNSLTFFEDEKNFFLPTDRTFSF